MTEALGADSSALAAAALAAEEALCLQCEALAVLGEAWGGESGSAAVDLVQRQCIDGSDIVAELHRVAGELALLRDHAADGSDPGPGPRPPVAAVGDPGIAPAVPPMAAAAPASAAWPGAGTPLPAVPDLGGSLVGLAGQIAELLGSGADQPFEEPFEEPVEDPPLEDPVGEQAEATGEPAQPQPVQSPVQPPPAPAVAPQQDSSPSAVTVTAPEPEPDPVPLLAAEAPPPVVPAADPVSDPATPCEIAADELPQVGG